MKRIVSLLLVCVLLLSCAVVLASCGKTLSGTYEAKVEAVGQSISTSYKFSGKKFELTVKTTFIGNVTTDTTSGTYEITENADGTLEIKFAVENDEGEVKESTYTLVKTDEYIKIGNVQYNKVK